MICLESMTSVQRNIIYILHFSMHEDALIDVGCIISNEISFQQGGLKKTQNFYMTSLLEYNGCALLPLTIYLLSPHRPKPPSKHLNLDIESLRKQTLC
jgi:hypothetical protein